MACRPSVCSSDTRDSFREVRIDLNSPRNRTVAGCGFVPPGGNGPCVSANFIVAATRVLIEGVPAVLQSSTSICTPTGTPLIPVQAQTRVIGM